MKRILLSQSWDEVLGEVLDISLFKPGSQPIIQQIVCKDAFRSNPVAKKRPRHPKDDRAACLGGEFLRSSFKTQTSFRLVQVITIKVHDLCPRGDEVVDELFLGVAAGIDFSDGPQLRVRTKHKVD